MRSRVGRYALLIDEVNGRTVSNYGQRYDLPSNRYEFAITDMKGDPDELLYEDEGIEPDVYLKPDQDFVEQVLARINQEKSR
jgi:hypothetical protein